LDLFLDLFLDLGFSGLKPPLLCMEPFALRIPISLVQIATNCRQQVEGSR
jgi:hypothetical protein